MEKISIFDIPIDNISFKESVDRIEEFLKTDGLKTIYTPNPEIVMKAKDNDKLKDILVRGDLVTADGIGLIYASRIKKRPLKERVTGFDMSMEMLKIANRESYSIYLLGGEKGVAKKGAENIKKKYPNIKVLGYHHGFFRGKHLGMNAEKEEEIIIEEINRLGPDIIFVGLGFPKQELWIDGNKSLIEKSKIIIGNGGVIDILAGRAKRAPKIWQDLGLEWLYRLIKNPSRLRRQLILPKFMLEVIFSKGDIVKEIKN